MALSVPEEQRNDELTDDAVLPALDRLVDTLARARALSQQARTQADAAKERRQQGDSYRAIATAEANPLVELVSRMIDDVVEAGSKFRRVHARALYEEGLTMDEIAALFGVTRQRVSAVLRKSGATTAATDKQARLSSSTEQNGEN